MKKQVSFCEFHEISEIQNLNQITEVVSDFGFCGVCGLHRRQLPGTLVVEVLDIPDSEMHPESQDRCRDGCLHRNCGNYSSYEWRVNQVKYASVMHPYDDEDVWIDSSPVNIFA